MKTSELAGALLDFWVAKAEGLDPKPRPHIHNKQFSWFCFVQAREHGATDFQFSRDWAIGGPVLERGLISLVYDPVDRPGAAGTWRAFFRHSDGEVFTDASALVAGMRALVDSKFGPEVEDL